MQAAPEPKSLLGRHRLLAPSASVRVSPLCIGGMSFGEAWGPAMGAVSKKEVFEILDYFHSHGGNFIDTANAYQSEESETWIGEWMASRPGLRDEMVVATKYSTAYMSYQGFEDRIHSNNTGNGTKSMHVSVRNSLRKLQTEYIDVLFVHWWDFSASIAEVMLGLNVLVQQGKVLYLGVSDTPAWVVAKANQYARDHGLRPFSVYQGKWSAVDRDVERDVIPMCANEGMGIMAWGALGSGNFKTKAQREALGEEGRKMYPPTEKDVKVTDALEAVAVRHGSSVTSVAMAFIMAKAPYVFPIVGGRKIEHLKGNIDALSIGLTDEEIEEIEAAWPFDAGFPHTLLSNKKKVIMGPHDVSFLDLAGMFDYVEPVRAIRPGGRKGVTTPFSMPGLE